MLYDLGAVFYSHQEKIEPKGGNLDRITRIDTTKLHPRLSCVEILIACDVDNPLTGEEGASAIFAPQKGKILRWFGKQCMEKPLWELLKSLRNMIYLPLY